jgi:putative phosphoesterase
MIGILSDAHGNYHAFLYALDVLKNLGAKEVVFLGDAIGYIPSIKVLEKLRDMDDLMLCIRGNHEDMLVNNNVDPKRDIVYQLNLTKSMMSVSDIDYIKGWHSSYTLNTQIGSLHFIHGSLKDPTYGYVYPDTDLSELITDMDYVFMGNSHYPFIRHYNKTTYINVGSCGLPRDDGRYGAVALFNPENGDTRIVRFDISRITQQSLSESPPVHTSVKQTFFREKEQIFGDLYES